MVLCPLFSVVSIDVSELTHDSRGPASTIAKDRLDATDVVCSRVLERLGRRHGSRRLTKTNGTLRRRISEHRDDVARLGMTLELSRRGSSPLARSWHVGRARALSHLTYRMEHGTRAARLLRFGVRVARAGAVGPELG